MVRAHRAQGAHILQPGKELYLQEKKLGSCQLPEPRELKLGIARRWGSLK